MENFQNFSANLCTKLNDSIKSRFISRSFGFALNPVRNEVFGMLGS